MTDLQKKYTAYRNELKKFNEQKDAWYTIANQRWNEGDKAGQSVAYAEADKIQAKIAALVNPMEDQLLGENEGLLSFDN